MQDTITNLGFKVCSNAITIAFGALQRDAHDVVFVRAIIMKQ
jgi:hypothetical protein